ncbi:hypothetical protein CQA53_02965 [Helicobacter didelphidarum]|uniref:Transmembrane protein n=1 Tax=Helicobacter didelphidarum TaxID=2040648 RepID=A0A3D8IPB6_9HELI|nr:hypothetical protein [Helicobacter didelphidarum]RDU66746.1 hypothetical protein CQA53_02965 [Helicobacter didelphidarum]
MNTTLLRAISNVRYFLQKLDRYRIYIYKDFSKSTHNSQNNKNILLQTKQLNDNNPQDSNNINYSNNSSLVTHEESSNPFFSNNIKNTEQNTLDLGNLFNTHKTTNNQYTDTLSQNNRESLQIDEKHFARVFGENTNLTLQNQQKDLRKYELSSDSNQGISLSQDVILDSYYNKDSLNLVKFYMQDSYAKQLSKIFKWRFFQRTICVLPPDYITSVEISIHKDRLRTHNATDLLCILQAKQLNQIPPHCEYRYFVKNITKEHIIFQIFCVAKETLQKHFMENQTYFLNPFEIFCSLPLFYPNLTYYTIIFQDQQSHAICHYIYGSIDFCMIESREKSLQDYFSYIDVLGEIFYCNWSKDHDNSYEFVNIESCFHISFESCLKILSLNHLYAKSLQQSFFPKDFYTLRTKIKILALGAFCVLGFSLLNFLFETYQYYDFIITQEEEHHIDLDAKMYKKQTYPSMYERIYETILKEKSLNFHLQSKYIQTKDTQKWEITP